VAAAGEGAVLSVEEDGVEAGACLASEAAAALDGAEL
jgi:hypothetical protein